MTQSKVTVITIAVMVGIILLGAVTIFLLDRGNDQRQLAASEAAAALSDRGSGNEYTDFDGNPANLDQYLGKVLVVTSWASWSPQSANELQLLTKTLDSYQADEVLLIAINRAESLETAELYLKTIGVKNQINLIVDNNDRYYKEIGGYTMPETLFYDQDGTIVAHKRGALTKEEIVANVEKALVAE